MVIVCPFISWCVAQLPHLDECDECVFYLNRKLILLGLKTNEFYLLTCVQIFLRPTKIPDEKKRFGFHLSMIHISI